MYEYCMGVELTIDNLTHEYYNDHFDLDPKTSGIIAASSAWRSSSRSVSDFSTRRFDMRDSLWKVTLVLGWVAASCYFQQAQSIHLRVEIADPKVKSILCVLMIPNSCS